MATVAARDHNTGKIRKAETSTDAEAIRVVSDRVQATKAMIQIGLSVKPPVLAVIDGYREGWGG